MYLVFSKPEFVCYLMVNEFVNSTYDSWSFLVKYHTDMRLPKLAQMTQAVSNKINEKYGITESLICLLRKQEDLMFLGLLMPYVDRKNGQLEQEKALLAMMNVLKERSIREHN